MSIQLYFLTSKDEEVDELLGLKLRLMISSKNLVVFNKVLIEELSTTRKKNNVIDDTKILLVMEN